MSPSKSQQHDLLKRRYRERRLAADADPTAEKLGLHLLMRTSEGQRVALVLAASHGLGLAAARALARGGHDVMICGRDEARLRAATAELSALGTGVVGIRADVSRLADIEKLYTRLDTEFGRLDVLVANAGGPPHGGFMEVTEQQWEEAFQLTLMSAARSIRLAAERMRSNRFGRILVIGSSSTRRPIEGLILSNTFRPALVGMVKSLAQELGPDGITTNMVSPGRLGGVRSRLLDERRARLSGKTYEEVRTEEEAKIPARRYGSPDDLARLIAFLAHEDSGYINGQCLLVDGGLVTALP